MVQVQHELDALKSTSHLHSTNSASSRATSAPLLHHAAASISRTALTTSQSKVHASKRQPADPIVIAATDATNAAIAAQNAEHSAAIAMHVAAHSEQIASQSHPL